MKKVKWQKTPNTLIMGPGHITDSHIIWTREYFNKRITYAPAVDAIVATETASARWDHKGNIDLDVTAPDLARFFGRERPRNPEMTKFLKNRMTPEMAEFFDSPHQGDEVTYTGVSYQGAALWMSSHGTAFIWISPSYSDMIQALHLTARIAAGGDQIYLDNGSANDQVGILAGMIGDDSKSAAIVEALRILAQTPDTD